LRGSAGFAPASLSSPSGEDAHSEGIGKELNVGMNVMGGAGDVNVDGFVRRDVFLWGESHKNLSPQGTQRITGNFADARRSY
jgi:hypothetical protein